MKNYKQLILVMIISIILGISAFLLVWFLVNDNDLKLAAIIFFTLWAFSLPASFTYFAYKVYPKKAKGTYQEGMLWGRMTTLSVILVAPFYAYQYYVDFLKGSQDKK